VAEWLKAEAHGDKKLAGLFERRFPPEFRSTFEAWKKTDPVNNSAAPAAPQLMMLHRGAALSLSASRSSKPSNIRHRDSKPDQHCLESNQIGTHQRGESWQPGFQSHR